MFFFNLQKDSNEIPNTTKLGLATKIVDGYFGIEKPTFFQKKKHVFFVFQGATIVFTQQVPKCSKDFWDPQIWSLLLDDRE